MKRRNNRLLFRGVLLLSMLAMSSLTVFATEDVYTPAVYATFWSLVPPLTACVLALITKEVYSSLFIGIVMGGLFYASFDVEMAMNHVIQTGILGSVGDPYNLGIIVFIIALGAIVCLMNKARATEAFGVWAGKNIKSRVGAQIATVVMGLVIFVDDYFNCLTVGSVMRPVTDSHNISRTKLAYLIDSTAAPICIIAPLSSWAAAVVGLVPGEDGFSVFLKAIPYNFYALLTITMIFAIILMKFDFGPMARYEENAKNGDLFTDGNMKFEEIEKTKETEGNLIDLAFPIISLILCCIIGMIYSGGFFEGETLINAFSGCDASVGLSTGSLVALILTVAFYTIRRSEKFSVCMSCVPEGFKIMVPAILILSFAWTLKCMTEGLGAQAFMFNLMDGKVAAWMNFLPAIIFVVGCFMAFTTGTSWGTFGILIPIVVSVFAGVDENLMIMSIAACMAGAVCGDHCSPLSDTTILSSAGAQCDHVNHVTTQLPYALTAAGVSFVTYLIAGFVKSAFIALPLGIIMMVAVLFVIRNVTNKKKATY